MASVAFLVLLSISYSVCNAQLDQTTENLITQQGWSGIGAYAPDPNNCCSNPAGSRPLYDTTTGIIKFSYGQSTVQQSIAVNQALANAGTGIQVSGYSWGYDIRNLNGHGGQGGTDSLTVNSWLKNTSGINLLSTSTTYNTQFDWTSFSGTQTLTSAVAPGTLSNVGISFSGKDSGFWAGLYGPEVRNVNLRLNYGVDPCATDPMYSPSCPGYADALLKLMPKTVEPTIVTSIAPVTTTSTTTPVVEPVNTSTTTTNNNSIVAPTTTTAVSTSTPSASNPQPKAGEVATSGSKPTVSMSTIMSILSTESSRVGAVEKSVVQQAASDAQKAGEQATQQAESVASTLTSQSMTASSTQTTSANKISVSSSTQSSVTSFSITQSVNSQVGIRTPYQVSNVDNSNTQLNVGSLSSNMFQISSNRNVHIESEVPQSEGIKFGSRSVLSDYLNAKAFMSMIGSEQLQDGTVKRNVQPNEVAGGVDINTIATQPKGYEVYSLATIPDTPFYKVDSIYKNQNTVDNVRTLRGLTGGSDRLHQEMVDLQYKGN